MRKYSEHRQIVSSDRYSEKETGRVTIFSQLHCPTQVFLLWVLLQVCRWDQETELIWMAGGRCQPRRRRHTHWLRYCICIYTLCLCVFCICNYSLCLCIFVFVSLLCVCVFVKKHSLTPLPWVDFISRPLINYWLKWKSAGISDISNFNAKDQSCLLTFARGDIFP